MSIFKSLDADQFDYSPFKMIGKDWMLITAQKDEKVNSMTASWGGMGVMWGKNVAFVVVRKSRYTKELIDGSDTFSLSFFDRDKYGKILSYMGSTSGRDEDKIEKSGLTVKHCKGIPFFSEATKVITCKKMCCQPINLESLIDEGIENQWYKDKDYHDLYIGEIVDILVK